MHKARLRKLVILLPGMVAMAVCWALPALAVSEADVEAAVASQGKEAVSGNLFVWFLCAIAFLKVSTKLDSILQAMGLGVGRAPGSILAETFMALRGMQAGKAILSGQMPGAGSRSAAAGAGTASAVSGGLAGMVSSKLETDTAASISGNGGGGICTLYAHCSRLLVRVGQAVSKYDTIAEVGSTGDSTGNHLHICFIVNGQYTDPEQYLH